MFKNGLFSLTMVMVLLGVFSQPVFADEKYQIQIFESCARVPAYNMTIEVKIRAEQWMNTVSSKVKIINHSLSFYGTTCVELTILYTKDK